jgi:hypothetical protein
MGPSVLSSTSQCVHRTILPDVLGEHGADALRGHLRVVDLVLPAHQLEVLLVKEVGGTGTILADDDVGAQMTEAVATSAHQLAAAAEAQLLERRLRRFHDRVRPVETAVRALADGDAIVGHGQQQSYGLEGGGEREGPPMACSSASNLRSSRETNGQ